MWKEEREVGSAERKAATGLWCQGPPGSHPPTEQRGHCSCRPICSPQASVGKKLGGVELSQGPPGKWEVSQGWWHGLGFLRIGKTWGDRVLGWNRQSEQRSLQQSLAWKWWSCQPWGFHRLEQRECQGEPEARGSLRQLHLEESCSICTGLDSGSPS